MKLLNFLSAFTFLSIICPPAAFAIDVAHCGESGGYSYFPRVGLAAFSPDAGRWQKDVISGGRLTVTSTAQNAYDVMILDSTGGIFSARARGAKVILLDKTKETLMILVVYSEGEAETYSFFRNEKGQPEVMWTQNKPRSLVSKVAAFTALCSYLFIDGK